MIIFNDDFPFSSLCVFGIDRLDFNRDLVTLHVNYYIWLRTQKLNFRVNKDATWRTDLPIGLKEFDFVALIL